jgi:uncharacterized protein (TIGR03435 family)
MARKEMTKRVLVLAACTFGSLHGQTPQATQSEQAQTTTITAAPLAFEVVSVKPAPNGTLPIVPAFMRDKRVPIIGLQTMAAPVSLTIAYAYHMQKSELSAAVRKQPNWVTSRIYTETFRAEGEPTSDQIREMMRTMLADRFGLQIHEFTRVGTVNRLVMSKPGVLGPNIKPHPEGASCSTQEATSVGKAPEASTPSVAHCGFTFYYLPHMVLHVGMTDTTIADAARTLAGMGVGGLDTRPLVDATGLTGKYDLTLEFRLDSGSPFTDSGTDDADDGGAPTLLEALKEQLGMHVESGQGAVRMVTIDHISEPTPD